MAGIPFLHNIKLNGNMLLDAKLHPSDSAPSNPGIGTIWYDTQNDLVKIYDNTATGNVSGWNTISGDITGVTSATTNQLTVATSSGPVPSFSIVTGAVADAGTALATGDQIHTFVTNDTLTLANKTLTAPTLTGDTQVNGDIDMLNKAGDGYQSFMSRNTLGSSAQMDLNNIGALAASGTVTAASLDISGDVDIDGTLETDALTINGSAISLNDLNDVLIEDESMYIGSDPSSTTNNALANLGVGHQALDAITTGDENTAVGHQAGTALTTGYNNTYLGKGSGNSATTGSNNVGIGYGALGALSTAGQYNVVVGSSAGHDLTNSTGDEATNNTFVGGYAGNVINSSGGANMTTGWKNTFIGMGATGSASAGVNQTAIGYLAVGGGDNTVVLGNSDVTAWLPPDDNGVDLGSSAKSFKDAHIQGVVNAGSLDISGDIDVDGTANLDAVDIDGNADIAGNLTVSGNLTVTGTTTDVDTVNLVVEDPLIKLAKNNNSSDAVDIGFYGLYDTSGSQDLFAGLFRDAGDGKFKLFKDLQAEPTTTVNTSGTGYTVATLIANIEGNVTGTADQVANNLTVDNTTIQLNSGTTYNGGTAKTISAKTAAIAVGGTGLATANQIYSHVTSRLSTEHAAKNKSFELDNNASGVASSDNITYTITHGMGASRLYKVEVIEDSGNYETVYVEVQRPSDTTIKIIFASAVTAGAYRALITKI